MSVCTTNTVRDHVRTTRTNNTNGDSTSRSTDVNLSDGLDMAGLYVNSCGGLVHAWLNVDLSSWMRLSVAGLSVYLCRWMRLPVTRLCIRLLRISHRLLLRVAHRVLLRIAHRLLLWITHRLLLRVAHRLLLRITHRLLHHRSSAHRCCCNGNTDVSSGNHTISMNESCLWSRADCRYKCNSMTWFPN